MKVDKEIEKLLGEMSPEAKVRDEARKAEEDRARQEAEGGKKE